MNPRKVLLSKCTWFLYTSGLWRDSNWHMRSSLELIYLIGILPGVQLSFGLAQGSVSLRQAVGRLRRISVVRRDLWPLRQEVVAAVVQPVIRVSADHVGGAAVRMVGGVAFLAVRHWQVFWAEGWHRLALSDAGRTSGEIQRNKTAFLRSMRQIRNHFSWTTESIRQKALTRKMQDAPCCPFWTQKRAVLCVF